MCVTLLACVFVYEGSSDFLWHPLDVLSDQGKSKKIDSVSLPWDDEVR